MESQRLTQNNTPHSADNNQSVSTRTNFDEYIVRKIQERIRWDLRINHADILLNCSQGHLKIYGYFDQLYRQTALFEIINSIAGIKSIDNQTRVLEDYHRSDKDIEKILYKQIFSIPFDEEEYINIQVKNGRVTFTGSVHHMRFKSLAARAAWSLSGVRDCSNLIQVVPKKLLLAS